MNDADQGALKPGDILNHTYRIKALVGMGGTGEVYRADNEAQGSEVAVKVLRREFAADERFVSFMQREAATLDSIVDNSVVRYYGLQKTADFGGLVFLVTEFIQGPSLADLMERGPVPADDLVRVCRRAAEGLRAAHAKEAFHRDLSPDNILLRDGDADRSVLIDFGIAKKMDSGGMTVTQGGFLGKYEYASPEQLRGQVDARSDIYSLGMTLLAAFHGRHPRYDDYDAMLDAKMSDPNVDRLPEPLRSLVARMLAPRPADRFQSAAELLAAIDSPVMMQPPGPASPGAPVFPGGPESQPGMPSTADAIAAQQAGAAAGAPAKGVPKPKGPKPKSPKPKGPVPKGEKEEGGVGGLIAALLLVCLLGGAGWFFGLGPGREMVFGDGLPVAAPYRLAASVAEDGAARATGDAPNPAAEAELRAALGKALGGGATVELRLASGAPSEVWPRGVGRLALAAAPLDSWTLQVTDARAVLAGRAPDESVKGSVSRAAVDAARLAGLTLDLRIDAPEKRLTREQLAAAADGIADCGPLSFAGGGPGGFAPGDPIAVTGRISSARQAGSVTRALNAVAEGRRVDVHLEPLNGPICAFERVLPREGDRKLRDGGLEIRLAWGADPRFPEQRKGPHDGASPFQKGENVVIDVVAPEGMKGRLHVYLINPDGKVYHTFPPRDAQENRLRMVQPVAVDGERVLRVQHSVAEIWDEPDDTPMKVGIVGPPYGLGMILAVVTEGEQISTVVPNEESAAAAVEDLAAAVAAAPAGSMVTTRVVVETQDKAE